MSYNGSGTFNINTAGQPVVTGTVISSTAFNALTADLGTGLSTAITKNGQTTVTANIPFNGYKLTGIAVATASGDALSYGQAATVAALTATSVTDSGLTSGRVTYAGTGGLLQDSANLTFNGTTLTAATGANFVTTSGSVGIGTSSPAALLDLGGSTASTVQQIFGRGVTDSSFTVRYTNGVSGSAAFTGTLGLDYANGTWADMAAIKFYRNNTAGELAFFASASATSGTERMRLTSTGLAVTGTVSASGLLSANANLKVVNGANDFGTIQLGTSASYVVTGGSTYSGYRFEVPSGSNQYDFQQGGTTRALINAFGIGLGATTPSSGTGITFPATQSASSNANTLDDYEEGYWTPDLRFGGANTGITYQSYNAQGFYYKIGGVVFFSCTQYLSSKGSATGSATVAGLPFTSTQGNGGRVALSINLSSVTYVGTYYAQTDFNSTQILLSQITELGVGTALTDTNFANTSIFFISGFYTTV